MKNQRGITLVALVITIIVMLILAGVTISIAMNGGILEQARDATNETVKGQTQEWVVLIDAEIEASKYTTPMNETTLTSTVQSYDKGATINTTADTITFSNNGGTISYQTDSQDSNIVVQLVTPAT